TARQPEAWSRVTVARVVFSLPLSLPHPQPLSCTDSQPQPQAGSILQQHLGGGAHPTQNQLAPTWKHTSKSNSMTQQAGDTGCHAPDALCQPTPPSPSSLAKASRHETWVVGYFPAERSCEVTQPSKPLPAFSSPGKQELLTSWT
ncbi:hypothetical protein H1C71_006913, partial [Ictidomys tridecemlineatus]